jgi:hypothetical protein
MFAVTTQSGRWNHIEMGVMEKTVWQRMQSGLRKKHAASDSAEFLLFARKPTRSAQADRILTQLRAPALGARHSTPTTLSITSNY